MAGLYVFVFWLISFVLPSWGTANVCGLDIPFFFLITTEALSDQGLFEVAKQAGLHLPNILFPLPWVVAFFILLSQSTSVFGHMFAIFIGIIRKFRLIRLCWYTRSVFVVFPGVECLGHNSIPFISFESQNICNETGRSPTIYTWGF